MLGLLQLFDRVRRIVHSLFDIVVDSIELRALMRQVNDSVQRFP